MTYESECAGKIRYQSRKAAKLAIRRMRGRDHDGRLNAYLCSWCLTFWHIGHFHPNARKHAQQRRARAADTPN